MVIWILFPKMRKRSGRLGGKGAPGSARAAILNSLAALEPPELTPLLELFLQPMSASFRSPLAAADAEEAAQGNELAGPAAKTVDGCVDFARVWI